jgi:hypothetical protein
MKYYKMKNPKYIIKYLIFSVYLCSFSINFVNIIIYFICERKHGNYITFSIDSEEEIQKKKEFRKNYTWKKLTIEYMHSINKLDMRNLKKN